MTVHHQKLRSKVNPHLALESYQSFVTQTGPLRAALEQSAGAAEAEIERAMDERRGKEPDIIPRTQSEH